MKRGTITWVDLSDAHPPEMGKVRPGIVVSNTQQNAVLDTVVVVPTSSLAPEIIPLRLALGKFAGKESFAIIPGIRQVRKSRLRGELGALSTAKLAKLDECLQAYLR
ncbi:MAG TPA: type II toxin-antitoxin system PemK/MazF family toxin [Opitutales bacterium]|nr:type II toxin-antitoxin system PemK/MazF family toxin [Opitutales bacterium]